MLILRGKSVFPPPICWFPWTLFCHLFILPKTPVFVNTLDLLNSFIKFFIVIHWLNRIFSCQLGIILRYFSFTVSASVTRIWISFINSNFLKTNYQARLFTLLTLLYLFPFLESHLRIYVYAIIIGIAIGTRCNLHHPFCFSRLRSQSNVIFY